MEVHQLDSGATSGVAAFEGLFFFRTSRWLPCRSGGDRKEPGRPAVEPRKGAGPQVKRNQSSDNACCNVSLLPHIVAKAQIEIKKKKRGFKILLSRYLLSNQ